MKPAFHEVVCAEVLLLSISALDCLSWLPKCGLCHAAYGVMRTLAHVGVYSNSRPSKVAIGCKSALRRSSSRKLSRAVSSQQSPSNSSATQQTAQSSVKVSGECSFAVNADL